MQVRVERKLETLGKRLKMEIAIKQKDVKQYVGRSGKVLFTVLVTLKWRRIKDQLQREYKLGAITRIGLCLLFGVLCMLQ